MDLKECLEEQVPGTHEAELYAANNSAMTILRVWCEIIYESGFNNEITQFAANNGPRDAEHAWVDDGSNCLQIGRMLMFNQPQLLTLDVNERRTELGELVVLLDYVRTYFAMDLIFKLHTSHDLFLSCDELLLRLDESR